MTSFACPNCFHKFEIRPLPVENPERSNGEAAPIIRSWLATKAYPTGKPVPTQVLHASLNEWVTQAYGDQDQRISKKMLGVVLSEAGWTPYRENNWRGWLPPAS